MASVPVPAGVTDVGTIMLAECGFEASIGTGLNQSDDDSDFVAFTGGFTFPYFGTVQTGVFINSNGNLTFGAGDTTFSPSIPSGVVNGLPRISPAFVDLNPGSGGDVFVNQFTDRFVVTWSNVPLFGSGGSNTFQVTMHASGGIDFLYNGMTTIFASVAASPGGTPTVQTVDFTSGPISTAGSTEAAFEIFNSGNPLDLDFHCVVWQPNATGGFDVRTFQFAPCVPAGTVSGVVLDSAGDPVANCPVIVTSSGDPSFLEVTQTGSDGSFEISGVSVPGGINVRVLPIDGIDPTAAATGILWGEGETLHVVVSPLEPMQKR
ncbi:MAG: carboxypeptidase regulatory-like domain-containing protein [Planctomycetes bacterium]|nr:carboxypeptidase regulatory-like domain-containing protein [Planctomycetota bacterium]